MFTGDSLDQLVCTVFTVYVHVVTANIQCKSNKQLNKPKSIIKK